MVAVSVKSRESTETSLILTDQRVSHILNEETNSVSEEHMPLVKTFQLLLLIVKVRYPSDKFSFENGLNFFLLCVWGVS